MRYCILCMSLLLAWGGWAYSRTGGAAPQPMSWPATVHVLGEVLVDPSDRDDLGWMVPAGTPIRRFDRQVPDDRLSLLEATRGAVVLAALAYPTTSNTIAGDVADHLRDAVFIPEELRSQFVLESEEQLRHANETAANWVRSSLQPGVEQPVGIIALWQMHIPQLASEQPQGRLIFVLVKASRMSAGDYRVTQLVYGDTRQIIR